MTTSEKRVHVCGEDVEQENDSDAYGKLQAKIRRICSFERGQDWTLYPDRWSAGDRRFRCVNDHVGPGALMRPQYGFACAQCGGLALVTFPEDLSGPLVHEAFSEWQPPQMMACSGERKDSTHSLGREIDSDAWFQTLPGKPFFIFAPKPGDFDIEVIAHALAMQCRFNGHVSKFYSVAEHSVMVMDLLCGWGCSRDVQRIGLLHDAAEAYIGDCIRPLKRRLPKFRDVESALERALSEQFGLPWPWPEVVKEADNMALAIERRDLLAPPPRPWRNMPEIPDGDIHCVSSWLPFHAKRKFLVFAHHLGLVSENRSDG